VNETIYSLEQLESMLAVPTNTLSSLVGLYVYFPKREGRHVTGQFDIVKTVLVCNSTIGLEVTMRCDECGKEPQVATICSGPGNTATERWTQVYDGSRHIADMKYKVYVCQEHEVDAEPMLIATVPASLIRALFGDDDEEAPPEKQEDDPFTPPKHKGSLN
jgi:hypothetical protein